MEHRWGARVRLAIPVRLTAAHSQLTSIGRLTDLSISGGLIAEFKLRPLARLEVHLEGESLPAYVVRVCDEGSAIEWCQFAPRLVIQLLRQRTVAKTELDITPVTDSAGAIQYNV